jgi:hypothetical protein
MSNNFRDFLPQPGDPRLHGLSERTAETHAAFLLSFPMAKLFLDGMRARHAEPFRGVTSDGKIIPDLYRLADEGAPTAAMAEAATQLIAVMNDDDKLRARQDIDSFTWRFWNNGEPYLNPFGLRLEEARPVVVEGILALLKASMGPQGFEKARNCMRANHFLGELVNAPRVMNELSYNFYLYGEPSLSEPWGWGFFGHHLCLNCLVVGKQMVISPTFQGAEPNAIDAGPWAGIEMFKGEERKGLELMRSLPTEIRAAANIYKGIEDPNLPPGRCVMGDQLHQAGSLFDNRVIPYEGVSAAKMSAKTQRDILDLAEEFLLYLPDGPRAARLTQIESQMSNTHFAWIGGYGDEDAFYFKIHSPVAIMEFDHHSGVFLTNAEPAKCHIHTLVRTPNGNDYGRELLRQHYDKNHPGRVPGELRRPFHGYR